MRSAIVMGKGELAIRIGKWFLNEKGYSLDAIVPVIPEPAWAPSFKNWGEGHGLKIIESGLYQDIPKVMEKDWKVDLVFSVFYDKIIEEWFIKKCVKILNIHNSPLPKYRGVSPINWALKNNESEHGVTIHEIIPQIDAGSIAAQLKYSIYPEFDEVIDVYKRAIEYGWVLFQQTMPILDNIKMRPQDESQMTYYNEKQNSLLGERRGFAKEKSIPKK